LICITSSTEKEIAEVNRINARSREGRQELEKRYGKPPRKYRGKRKSLKQHALDTIEKRNKKIVRDTKKAERKITQARKEHIAAGNDPKDFEKALESNFAEKQQIIEAQAAMDSWQERLDHLDKAVEELTSDEGKAEYIKEAKASLKKEQDKDKADANKDKAQGNIKKEKEEREEIKEKVNKKREEETKTGTEEEVEGEPETTKEEKPKVKTQPIVQVEETPVEDVEETTTETGEEVDPQAKEDEAFTEAVEEAITDEVEPEFVSKEEGDNGFIKESQYNSAYETQEGDSTSDMLVVNAANTFAYLSKMYIVDSSGMKQTTGTQKNENLVPELESPNFFKPGTKITLALDEEAVWIEADPSGSGAEITRSYKDFVNPDGSLDVGNVPIVIKDEEGNKIAYVRTQDKILEVHKGDYANVANSNDPESPVYGNAQKQAAANLALRHHIINNGGSIDTEITSRSAGQLSRNIVDGKKDPIAASEAVPKLNKIVIVKNGEAKTGSKTNLPDTLLNTKEFQDTLYQREGHVLLPIPAPNGKTLLVPTLIKSLSETQVEAAIKILQIHYDNNIEEGEEVWDMFGLDPTKPKEARALLQTLTHVVSDSEDSFNERVSDIKGNKKQRHLSFDSESRYATAGKTVLRFAPHGGEPIVIKNREDFETHKEALRQLLSEKLFSVRLSNINKNFPVSELTINEEGKIDEIQHDSYNDYAKQYIYTDVKGNKVNEEEDSYFDQPVIEFRNPAATPGSSTIKKAKETVPDGPPVATEVKSEPETADETKVQEDVAPDEFVEEEFTEDVAPWEEYDSAQDDKLKTFLLASGTVEYLDEKQYPCKPVNLAKDGARGAKFTKNSEWEVVKDLKGYPSHAKGGVDIQFTENGFSFKNNKGVDIKAEDGLVLPSVADSAALAATNPDLTKFVPGSTLTQKQFDDLSKTSIVHTARGENTSDNPKVQGLLESPIEPVVERGYIAPDGRQIYANEYKPPVTKLKQPKPTAKPILKPKPTPPPPPPPTPEERFQAWRKSAPSNLRIDDPSTYNLRGYWEAEGEPDSFNYSQPKHKDGTYHAYSRSPKTGELLKTENHPSFYKAIEEDKKIGFNAYRNKTTGKIHTFDKVPQGKEWETYEMPADKLPKYIKYSPDAPGPAKHFYIDKEKGTALPLLPHQLKTKQYKDVRVAKMPYRPKK
jgi:hypothetical protein